MTAVVLVLVLVAAGCGGEEQSGPGTTASAPPSSAETPTEASTDEAPPDTDVPVLTVAGTGLPAAAPTLAAGEPVDACAAHWNDARNAPARRAVADREPSGALLRLGWDLARVCVVWVIHGDSADAYVEAADGVFVDVGDGAGLAAPPEWTLQPDGTLGERLDPIPPPATITGRTTVTAGIGSFCWTTAASQAICADAALPACGDGFTPRLLVSRGAELRIELPFEPIDAPMLSVFDEQEPVQHRLDRSAAPAWQVDLPEGRHPIAVFARNADGNDVSYTVCVDVEPGAATPDGPESPAASGS